MAEVRGDLSMLARSQPLSDRVADMLQEAILANQFQQGEQLPSERELGDRLGVSRTVVREAVRSLSARGLVEVRPGSGSWVTSPTHDDVVDSIALALRSSAGLGYEPVHEVRTTLELQTVALATERASEADLNRLQAVLDAMASSLDDADAASRLDMEFHQLIAKFTHNPLFPIVLDSIGTLMMDVRRRTLAIAGRPERAHAEHSAILAAIRTRDPETAKASMLAHLTDSREVVAQTNPQD